MRVLGIEFESNKLHYVLIELEDDGSRAVRQKGRTVLSDTRSRDALTAFQNAVSALFNTAKPDLIGIKAKPESGRMRGGAAALKMEGIVLASSPCTVDFVSPQRIGACTASDDSLHGYLQPALKAAHAALAKRASK